MPPRDLPSYVRWVIEQKPELRDTPEDVRQELQVQLEDRLENLIDAALLAALPPDELPHFEKMLQHSTQDEIQKYLEQSIPDMDEVVARVMVEFRNEYLRG